MPPQSGEHSAGDVSHNVIRVTRRPAHNVGADPLKKDGPHDEVECDFGRGWRPVVRAKPELSFEPQQQRKRARHQKQVVEVIVKEATLQVGLETPAIQSVERTGQKEQTVVPIAECVHSRARITKPKATARAIFKRRTMVQYGRQSDCLPPFSAPPLAPKSWRSAMARSWREFNASLPFDGRWFWKNHR